MTPPTPASRLAAIEADLRAQADGIAALHKLVQGLAEEVTETVRVTGCMDERNRERDDWLRNFASVYRSPAETAQRAALSDMLAEWQAVRRARADRRSVWGQVALGLGVLWTTLLVLQYLGGHALAAIRAVTGGAP